jgi:hypothetical protein
MVRSKSSKKSLLPFFEVRGSYTLEFETCVQAPSKKRAEEMAYVEFRKELRQGTEYACDEEITIKETECVMESKCALCGREKFTAKEEKVLTSQSELSFDLNTKIKARYPDGELICPEHLEKPGRFWRIVKRLKNLAPWLW